MNPEWMVTEHCYEGMHSRCSSGQCHCGCHRISLFLEPWSRALASKLDHDLAGGPTSAPGIVAQHEELCGCALDDCEFKVGYRAALRVASEWGGA